MKIKLPLIHRNKFESLFNEYAFNEIKLDNENISSHWKKYMSKTLIKYNKVSDFIYIQPHGFDDFKKNNFLNNIINIPKYIYLKKHLNNLSNLVCEKMYESISLQGRILTYNCLKNALTIDYILKYNFNFNNYKVAIIGDGNGFLGILLKLLFPKIKIVQINLGKILLFDFLFSANSKIFKNMDITNTYQDYKKSLDCNFIPAERIFNMNIDDIDFFFNIASMGEMNPIIIKKYFDFMRKQKTKNTYFYCCNRVTKVLPDGTKTKFDDYDWLKKDKTYFNEICKWYNYSPMSRPPFIKKFDGKFRHKLVKFK